MLLYVLTDTFIATLQSRYHKLYYSNFKGKVNEVERKWYDSEVLALRKEEIMPFAIT